MIHNTYMITDEKIQELIRVQSEITDVINRFSVEKRLQKLFGRWSLRDIIAHINGWMVHDIDCLNHLKQNKEPYWEPDIDDFNEKTVLERQGWSWDRIYKEFLSLNNELISLYKSLPLNLWNTQIWANHSLTAAKFLDDDISHLLNEHLPQIKTAIMPYLAIIVMSLS